MAAVWNITNLEYNNDSDKGVLHASWICSDSETVGSGDNTVVHTGTVLGMESFTPNPSKSGYVAYDSLTEAKVRSWVKSSLGTDKVAEVEDKVAAQITKSKTPPTAWGKPWS